MIAINLLLGMLLSLRYSPMRHWPHRHWNHFALHRWTAYLALVTLFLHPVVLLFATRPRFSVFDIAIPIHSPLQPTINVLGAIALYLLLAVIGTSILRNRMPRRLWRNLHYLVYPAAVLLLLHSLLTDPNLINGHPDYTDGGKVFIEITILVLAAAFYLRYRLRGRGLRPLK
jgi:predicted ferric reductase